MSRILLNPNRFLGKIGFGWKRVFCTKTLNPYRWNGILSKEHEYIKQTMQSFGCLLDRIELDYNPQKSNDNTVHEFDMNDIKSFMEFTEEYSHKLHHFKEEHILFTTINESKHSDEYINDYIGDLTGDHQSLFGEWKNLYGLTKDHIKEQLSNNPNDLILPNKLFIDELMEHITYEDTIVYKKICGLHESINENISKKVDEFEEENIHIKRKMQKIVR